MCLLETIKMRQLFCLKRTLIEELVQPDPALALKLSEHKPNHLGPEAKQLHNLAEI